MKHSRSTTRNPATLPRAFRPRLETLEQRDVPSGFNFTDFSTTTGLNLVGTAAVTTTNRLRLTPAQRDLVGGAWYVGEKPIVGGNFETTFRFQMTDGSGAGTGGEDGFAFLIQNSGPAERRAFAGRLGYDHMPNSVAVEFDVARHDSYSDPSQSHISVHTNGTGPNSVDESYSLGIYNTPFILDDAQVHTAKIQYAPGTLSVYLDNLTTPVLTVSLDLATTLNLDAGRAWIGFTAATGGGWENHDILNWSFQGDDNVIVADRLSVVEGNTGSTPTASFTIRRLGNLAGQAVVNWITADGTARAGTDYLAASGQVVFADGESQKTVAVTLLGDNTPEPDESFKLLLSTMASYTATSGLATIRNDDTILSVEDATATEGDGRIGRSLGVFVSQSDNGGIDSARGMAWGPDGNLYVGSSFSHQVLRFDGSTGAFLGTFITQVDSPAVHGLVFRPDALYVLSRNEATVRRFNATTGAFLDVFIPPGLGGLMETRGMTFGPDGNWYISSHTNEILRYSASGAFLGAFVSAGSGGLLTPRGVTFGPDGKLYVASENSHSVLRYNGQTGAFIDAFVPAGVGGLYTPAELLFHNGSMYVSCSSTDEVLRFDAQTGAFLDKAASPGQGGLDWPLGLLLDANNNLLVGGSSEILRYGPLSQAAFTVRLNYASANPVTVNYAATSGTATAGNDFTAVSGTLTFAPGETVRTIIVQTLDDSLTEGTETFSLNLSDPVGATIANGQSVGTIADDEATKFFVADDASTNRTFRYGAPGNGLGNSNLASGNSAPRGAASTAAGDKVWVVDANKNVYVYTASGNLLGSWTAGSVASNAQVEGIATNGTDVWLVDAKQDKVFRYVGAASRLSGSQNAASSFNLNSANSSPKDLVTDGTSIWVVNDSTTDKVFKYTLGGSLVGSWTLSGGGGSPTGITLDPSNAQQHLWVVDSGADKVFQYDNARSRTSGSQVASAAFALATGNTNPQGIADPPAVSIEDATVTEGDTRTAFLGAFVASQSGGLDIPRGLTFGPDGDLFVVSEGQNGINRYGGSSGNYLAPFVPQGSGGLNRPHAAVFGPDGHLYVTSRSSNEVLRYNGTIGTFLGAFVTAGSGGLTDTTGLAFGPDGHLLVISRETRQVLKYRGPLNVGAGQVAGEFLGVFANTSSAGSWPQNMTFGPDGNLYVGGNAGSSNTYQIDRYDGVTGALINIFVPAGSPLAGMGHFKFHGGQLYVPSGGSNDVLRFQGPADPNPGAFIDRFVPAQLGGLSSPTGMVFGTDGNAYVSSFGTNAVLRYGAASQAALTVRLDTAAATPVTVQFATANGTAFAGSDFTAATGTVTFSPGQTTRTILVRTLDDALAEPAETFIVNLSNAVGADIADGQAVATITDNDPPTLRVGSITVNGGAAQRSRVTQLAVTFSGVAALPANPAVAFRLTRLGGGPVGGFTATAATVGGVTVVTLANFTGAQTVGGSLADGRYALTVVANQLPNFDGNGDGTAGDDYVLNGTATNGLFRYYGDADGDGDVDGTDLVAFVPTLFNAGGYNPAFDFDGDGDVDGTDLVEFVQNLFVPLP